MADLTQTNVVDGKDLGLTRHECAILARMTTPQNLCRQYSIPVNHEPDGETIRSVREVLRVRRAHCIEAAFLAACAMWVHGAPPLVMHMDCDPSDYPHVVTLFRCRGSWGAISKSNGAVLRFRDPIYRSLRASPCRISTSTATSMGRRTLRSYSVAFDLRCIDPRLWVTSEDPCQEAHDRLAASRHYSLISPRQERSLCRAAIHSSGGRRGWWNIRRRKSSGGYSFCSARRTTRWRRCPCRRHHAAAPVSSPL